MFSQIFISGISSILFLFGFYTADQNIKIIVNTVNQLPSWTTVYWPYLPLTKIQQTDNIIVRDFIVSNTQREFFDEKGIKFSLEIPKGYRVIENSANAEGGFVVILSSDQKSQLNIDIQDMKQEEFEKNKSLDLLNNHSRVWLKKGYVSTYQLQPNREHDGPGSNINRTFYYPENNKLLYMYEIDDDLILKPSLEAIANSLEIEE